MKAFNDDTNIKEKYMSRLKAHALADEIVKGIYWENGKGCAVGCTIHSSNHKAYETELGVPQWLARVEDRIFEGLPNDRAKLWPIEFLNAVNVGSDLEKIKAPFMIYILESVIDKFDHKKFPEVLSSVNKVIELYKNNGTTEEFMSARAAAAAAAYAAAAVAYAADADAAVASAVAYADAAAAVAYAAADAAVAAVAYTAADAAVAAAADVAVRENSYVKFADKLLELIRDSR